MVNLVAGQALGTERTSLCLKARVWLMGSNNTKRKHCTNYKRGVRHHRRPHPWRWPLYMFGKIRQKQGRDTCLCSCSRSGRTGWPLFPRRVKQHTRPPAVAGVSFLKATCTAGAAWSINRTTSGERSSEVNSRACVARTSALFPLARIKSFLAARTFSRSRIARSKKQLVNDTLCASSLGKYRLSATVAVPKTGFAQKKPTTAANTSQLIFLRNEVSHKQQVRSGSFAQTASSFGNFRAISGWARNGRVALCSITDHTGFKMDTSSALQILRKDTRSNLEGYMLIPSIENTTAHLT